MSQPAALTYADLESAYYWVGAAAQYTNSAFISRRTGRVYPASVAFDSPDELPPDIDDASLYLAVPHPHDLDLGRELLLDFIEAHLPDDLGAARSYFDKRGAYARAKDLLHRRGAFDAWHRHENQAIEAALRAWARDNGLRLDGPEGVTPQRAPKDP